MSLLRRWNRSCPARNAPNAGDACAGRAIEEKRVTGVVRRSGARHRCGRGSSPRMNCAPGSARQRHETRAFRLRSGLDTRRVQKARRSCSRPVRGSPEDRAALRLPAGRRRLDRRRGDGLHAPRHRQRRRVRRDRDRHAERVRRAHDRDGLRRAHVLRASPQRRSRGLREGARAPGSRAARHYRRAVARATARAVDRLEDRDLQPRRRRSSSSRIAISPKEPAEASGSWWRAPRTTAHGPP
jgi:hypothetical protein